MTEDKPKKEEVDKLFKALSKAGDKMGFEVLSGKEAHEFMEREMNKPEHVKARAENAKKNKSILDTFFSKEHKYKWTKEMGEISGFGGSYERGCRAMVIAGLEYWDSHPDLNPRFKGYKNVYGILSDDNEDAKMLEDKMMEVVDNDCTGAMHQASVSAVLYIKKNGWDKYVREMSKRT